MEPEALAGHLTDEGLFSLALPPAGEPEALPSHLLRCVRCRRALQDWKRAIGEIGEQDEEDVGRRTPEQWRAAEDRTLEALSHARRRKRFRPLPWAVGLAAALLLVALVLPGRRAPEAGRPAAQAGVSRPSPARADLSPQDAADDALLREVAMLSRGEDGGAWNRLAPDPMASTTASREDPL